MNDISCVIDWPGTMSATKDVVVAIAAAVTAWAAYRGLSKWRQEESGKADFDLARRVGIEVFHLRDALSDARRPIFAYELPPQSSEEAELSRKALESLKSGDGASAEEYAKKAIDARQSNKARELAYVFENRHGRLRESYAELRMLQNEVEALWGTAMVPLLEELSSAVIQYFSSVNTYIAREGNQGNILDTDKQPDNRIISDVFSHMKIDGENELTKQTSKTIEHISAYLRTKLPRPSK